MNGLEVKQGKIKTGYDALDKLMSGNGIFTIRCLDERWLFHLLASIMVRNLEDDKRILYLHWADYHKRFWTLDYDQIIQAAKENGTDMEAVLENIFFQRAFSRDNNEVKENWEKILAFSGLNLIILDSITELYEEKKADSLPLTYAIGKFSQLCSRNDCAGIVLDRSAKRIHPYLAHVSSVILELSVDRYEIIVKLLKHAAMAEMKDYMPRNKQFCLSRWL